MLIKTHMIKGAIIMKYEVISLPEKTLVGIGLKSSNSDPQLGEKIGALWNQFFNDELYLKIKNKKMIIRFVSIQIMT